MSRSDDGGSIHLPDPLRSRPASKAGSESYLSRTNPTRKVTLNILFLGETSLGESSIIDFIAGPEKQEYIPHPPDCGALGGDVRGVALGGKMFILHASPTSQSVSAAVLEEGIQKTLTNLRRSGGVHLLVYCMNALHPTSWIRNVHRAVASHSNLSPPIPAAAIISGLSDVVEQESWWSSNEDALAKQGPRFDDHGFIRVTTTRAHSPTGDHISESRRVLQTLILENCSSERDTRFRYLQRSMATSFQPLLHAIAGKPSSSRPTTPKTIGIVLLGEIGVGKSSLINLIARKDAAGVSPDTVACTTSVDMYAFEERGRTFRLYDTPGLNDPQMGVRAFVDPIDIIQKKIRSIGNGNGPDLLLFCIDNSKPTAALQRNYHLFYRIICGGNVPSALAITKLEEGQGADQWWDQHKATIRRFGIDCSGHVGLGRVKKHSDPNVDLEEESRESLLSLFITCAGRQRQKTGSLRFSIGRMAGSLTTFLRSQVSTLERILMNQCALEEDIARELASRLVASEQNLTNNRVTA